MRDDEPAAPEMSAGYELLELMRQEAGHLPSVAEWIAKTDRWIEHGGDVPMQRFLNFPSTAAARCRYRRNKWLTRAAQLIEADGPAQGAAALAKELGDFSSRGPWRHWRDRPAPPEEAKPIHCALFWVLRFGDGEVLTARRLQDLVGSVWRQKFPADVETLEQRTVQELI